MALYMLTFPYHITSKQLTQALVIMTLTVALEKFSNLSPMHLLTEADFGSAVRFTQAHLPRSIVVHHWLLLRDQEDVSSVQHTSSNSLCYADRWPNPTALFVIDFCKFASHERYPFAAFFSSQLEKPGGVLEFLEAVEAKHGFTENNGFVLGSLPVEWLPVFKAVFERGEFTFDKWSQLKLFHLPESHRPSLHQAVADLQLDEQFCLDTLRVEDAQLVNDCWPHRFEEAHKPLSERLHSAPPRPQAGRIRPLRQRVCFPNPSVGISGIQTSRLGNQIGNGHCPQIVQHRIHTLQAHRPNQPTGDHHDQEESILEKCRLSSQLASLEATMMHQLIAF
ncbi:insertion sequence transposase protein, IS3 family [Trichinella spiralis]|uniref:insertion sequence transposase protein, IS3 family n=1 Tax=Trichinella spiralis TaxID=6334 RepID=UPI0001EFB92F|nr:insertion sequence transposase protein, IS3 family [Trichinella spiralis]